MAKTLKQIIKTLEKAQQDLYDLVEARELQFDERSERWQESEKGEEFEEKTNDIDLVRTDIEGAIQELEDLT